MINYPIIQTYRKLSDLLNRSQRRKGMAVILYSIVLGIADLIAITATVPLLVLTIDKSFLRKSSKLRWVFEQTNLETEADFLILLIVVILVFFILKNLFGIWFRNRIKDQCASIASLYAERLYNKYLSKDYLSSVQMGTSEMIDKLIYYPFQLSHGIIFPFVTLITEAIAILLIVSMILLYNPIVFIVLAFILGPSLFVIFRFTKKKLYHLGSLSDKHRAETIKGINIGLNGLQDIKFNDAEDYFLSRYKKTVGNFLDSNLRSLVYQYIPSRTNEVVAMIALIIFAIYGYFFSENVGGTRVLAALFALSVFRLMPALNKLMASLMSLKTYQRVLEEDISLEEETSTGDTSIPFSDNIELKNISFSFKDSNKPLFNNINFTIKKGQCSGIYGESGNGKSTLLKIATGVIKDYQGQVLIDGLELNRSNYKQWQNQIAYVSQHPFILNGTLLENIALGEDIDKIDKKKAIECIKQASLDVFFNEWNEDLNIQLGETGSMISEGQKQRVCIARALYKEVKVLVLDEATSSLDEENEKQIQEAIKKLKDKNYTILIIAHKKSFLSICNETYILKEGNLTLDK